MMPRFHAQRRVSRVLNWGITGAITGAFVFMSFQLRAQGALDNSEIARAAIIAECGFNGRTPRGNPFTADGELSAAWEKLDISRFKYTRSFANSSFKNPICEQFLLQMIRKDNNGLAKFKDRCESIRSDVNDVAANEAGANADIGNFSALDSFFDSSSSSVESASSSDPCEDADALGGNRLFACKVLAFREITSSGNAMKTAANQIKRACEKAGVDMRPRMTSDQYLSYANSGIHFMGAYCGGGGGGGVVIVQQQNKWYDTLANTVLGLAKVGLPIWAMHDANRRQQANARLALQYNRQLGFPSAVTAGANTPWNVGCGGGFGGCGYGLGWYGGGGYGYSGHGGGCPVGYCYGNGGIIVGGGYGPGWGGGAGGGVAVPVGPVGPGVVLGGPCGIPPYAAGYLGCGGGAVGGPGMVGAPVIGGTPGFYGPGGAGYPYGIGGVAGMPGPYGTIGGGNGWGGPGLGVWGPGGLYGQTPFYGSGASGFDAQQAALMAQQMQEYAQLIQRQAELAHKAQQQYREDLSALYKVYSKSTQSYLAAQQAQYSLGGLQGGMMGGVGALTGYGSVYGSGYYYGGGGGFYYPPFASGSGGRGLNIGLGINYSR